MCNDGRGTGRPRASASFVWYLQKENITTATKEKGFLRAATSAKGWQVRQCTMESAFFKSAAHHAPISSKST